MSLLWLLILIPPALAIALGAPVELASVVPPVVVLAVVGWSSRARSPLALRTRKELRLALIPAVLMLLVTGSGALLAASLSPALDALFRTLLPMLAFVLPAATLLSLLSGERDAGTFEALLVSPRGRRALIEKAALGALLLGASFVQLRSFIATDDLQWLALAGYALPFVSTLSCFLLVRTAGGTLGLTLVVPLLAAVMLTRWNTGAEETFIIGYGLVMLALLPWLLRRGVSAPTLDELLPALPTRGLKRLPPFWFAELTSQRDAIICALIGWVSFAALRSQGSENAAPVQWLVCTFAAALSPVLAFSEPRRDGTLEWLLAVRPRAQVFTAKVLLSAGVVLVGCVALPLAMQVSTHTAVQTGPWLLSMGFAWSVSLVVSMYARGAGPGLGFAMLAIPATGVIIAVAFLAPWFLGAHFADGHFLALAYGLTALAAVALAWWRFVRVPLAPVRGVVMTVVACVVSAGALSVVGQ